MPFLDFTDINLPPASTRGNYRSTLTNMRNAFRLVFRAAVIAIQTNSTDTGPVDERIGSEPGAFVSCDASKVTASANYDSGSFGPGVVGQSIGLQEYTANIGGGGGSYAASLSSFRGKFKCDLTNYTGTNGFFYFIARAGAQGLSNEVYCPVTVDAFYHKSSSSFSTGGMAYSSIYGSQKPTFSGSNDCPIDSFKFMGWDLPSTFVIFQYAVFNVTFTNTF
jgi:hypothetical protein